MLIKRIIFGTATFTQTFWIPFVVMLLMQVLFMALLFTGIPGLNLGQIIDIHVGFIAIYLIVWAILVIRARRRATAAWSFWLAIAFFIFGLFGQATQLLASRMDYASDMEDTAAPSTSDGNGQPSTGGDHTDTPSHTVTPAGSKE